MAGLFLDDQRDPNQVVTYSAQRAMLLREGMEARLVMQEGVAISVDSNEHLTAVRFDQFVFDLSEILNDEAQRVPRPSEYGIPALLAPTPEMLERGRYSVADFVSEAHYKLSLPLLAMIYPMIALVTLLAGGYRRSGFGKRVVVAIGVATLLQILMFAARAKVQDNVALWPLMYAPVFLGILYLAALILRLSRARRVRAVPA